MKISLSHPVMRLCFLLLAILASAGHPILFGSAGNPRDDVSVAESSNNEGAEEVNQWLGWGTAFLDNANYESRAGKGGKGKRTTSSSSSKGKSDKEERSDCFPASGKSKGKSHKKGESIRDDDENGEDATSSSSNNGKSAKKGKGGDEEDEEDECREEEDPGLICTAVTTLSSTDAVLSATLDLNGAFQGIVSVNKTTENGDQTGDSTIRRVSKQNSVPLDDPHRGLQEVTNVNCATLSGEGDITEGVDDGTRRLHFTYVIDTSGSTTNSPTVFDLEKEAIKALNHELSDTTPNVVSVGLVPFASTASPAEIGMNVFLVDPSNPSFNNTVDSLESGGGTNFENALGAAFSQVDDVLSNDPTIDETYVVFVTDGKDTNIGITRSTIDSFVDLGTQVFTYAIGSSSECSSDMESISVDTGAGSCQSVVDPEDLEDRLQETFFSTRSLRFINATLGDDKEIPLEFSTVTPQDGLLPSETPVSYTSTIPCGFNVSFTEEDSVRSVCITAESNVTDDPTASCCVDFTIEEFVGLDDG